MKTKLNTYSNFLFRLMLKKKSSYVVPIITLICSAILAFVVYAIKPSQQASSIILYSYSFGMLLFTVLYSSIKAINIFKDLEAEGIDILTFAKPLSRKYLTWGKIIVLLYLGLFWVGINFLGTLLVFTSLLSGKTLAYVIFIGLITYLLTFTTFGYFTSLIAYKINQKAAITIPLLLFAPLAIGGTVISVNSTSSINNAAYYINRKYDYHNAGNEADLEGFYLNNNRDSLYLIPNGLENSTFKDYQDKYLNTVYSYTKNAATEWQTYSWLITPYQMLDIFNVNNNNIFKNPDDFKNNNLSNFVYYKNQDNLIYKYSLNKKPKLFYDYVQYENKLLPKYIVPGILKDNSVFNNQNNTSIIYARKNASSFDAIFNEDNYVYSSPNNLVGKLEWKKLEPLLQDEKFNIFAKTYFAKKTQNAYAREFTQAYVAQKLQDDIFTNNFNDVIDELSNPNVAILDKYAVKDGQLKSETERKIYFAIGLIYYFYFSYNDSPYLATFLANKQKVANHTVYNPSQFAIEIDGYKYLIGGYESFEAKQRVIDGKVVIRYDLIPSNKNYLFQTLDNVYAIERTNKVVNKNYYILIWLVLSVIFMVSTAAIYMKKDYR